MALIGHSLGGYVALQSAIRGAANIERLALIAPGGVAPVGQPLLRMLRLPLVGELSQARYSRIGLKLMIDNITHTNDTAMIEQMVEWGSRSMKDAKNRKQFLYQLRLSSDIESVADIMNDRSPMVDSSTTRIFWGRHDPIFPVMAAFELQQMLNCAPPIIFENSGHLPQIEEQDTFNQALEQFLTGDAVTSHEHSLDF
jgi:pimeloyl-ACP methyl ester carboxylesterase